MSASHKQYKWSLQGMVFGLAALVAGFGLVQPVQAQEWPAKPVRLVSPYPPGGVADIAARLISAKLADIWKQQVLVENRVGGGGVVGTEHVAKAAPDGYTFLVATVGEYTITPHMYAKLNFNVGKDLAPVIFATDTPLIFAANVGASFNNVKEMIAYSRSVAGGLSYASPGLATVNHVVAERFALESGAKLVHVPYKGGGPAGAALAGGVIAGYPVVDVKVALIDGSYHDVDSSEMAFKIAGSMAVKDAVEKASPTILEPVMKVEVTMPESFMGDVIGDLNSRRGQVGGMESRGSTSVVRANVPLAQMFGYATDLRSMTQGRASYSMELSHYAEVPAAVAAELVQKSKV